MKSIVKIAMTGLLFLGTFNGFGQTLELGDKKVDASSVSLVTTADKSVALNDYKGNNGLLVIFSCNTCPFVVGKAAGFPGWEKDYNNIVALAKARGFGVVLVNSNEAQRADVDAPKKMEEHAKANKYLAPYIIDKGHKLADLLEAKTTPHVYLFNANNQLIYSGAIDNSVDPKAVEVESYLVDAINNWDKEIQVKSTKPVGCSIKRVSK